MKQASYHTITHPCMTPGPSECPTQESHCPNAFSKPLLDRHPPPAPTSCALEAEGVFSCAVPIPVPACQLPGCPEHTPPRDQACWVDPSG